MNVWRAVQILAFPKLRSALIVPEVVTGFVPPRDSVPFGVASVTDVTVPLPPLPVPMHAPLIAKQPPVKLIPPVAG